MKRFLAILVSALMIIGLALPVLASPFSDLPDSHWATDAVKMLSALGIVQGYPDGSFKGHNQATRYEVALMVARALEYLDKDIRNLTERLNQLQVEPVEAQPEPVAGEVVLQAPAPDATILEQVIAEKIAGMSEAQWEEFDDRLSALLARIDDLSEKNKAEHAILAKALEALHGGPVADKDLESELELALLQQKAELMMAFYDSIAAANDERDRAIEQLKAELDQALLDQQAVLMASYYDVLEAYKGEHEIDHAALEAKFEALLDERVAALDSVFKEGLAEVRDEISLAMLEQKAELTMAFYDSMQALKDENEQKFAAIDEKWERALLEQKAELTMAFYDSVQALKDENEQKFAAIDEKWERMLLEQKAELTMAFYDSIQALRDENEQRFASLDEEFVALEEKWERMLLEQKAELTMAFYDSIEALKDEYEQRFASLEEKWEIALLEQKAELTMAFYDSIEAERDARIQALDEFAAKHEQDLIDAKAEMSAATYDALEAVRGEFSLEIYAVMAVIDSLRSEYDTELKALGARIDAVDAALNTRIDALEAEVADVRALADQNAFDIVDTYHKIKAEDIAPLTERVERLEQSAAVAQADIKALRGDFNKVRIGGSNELKFVDIDDIGEVHAGLYKDPFAGSGSEYKPTSKLENTLKLVLKLQPREGVNIDIGARAVTDVFAGLGTLTSGDIDALITTPHDVTKLRAGALDRPGNFTKYQMSAAEFAEAGVRGISADYERGDLSLTGMIAKLDPSEVYFQYALGAGTQFKLTDKLTLGARVLQIRRDTLSGGIYPDPAPAPEEIVFGGDFALQLTEQLSLGGEMSKWKKGNDAYLTAYNLGAQGKLGFLNIKASHEQVEDDYAPRFADTVIGFDDEYLEDNVRASKLTIETDPIRGFVITGEVGREGDAYYAGKDKSTYGAKLAYNTKLLEADLTLRGGLAQVDSRKPVPAANPVTTAQLGFDVAYRPIQAGFTWEREIESTKVGYIGYAKADIRFGDALTIKGGWEQRFGSKEYYKYNAGLVLSLPVVPDKVTLGAEAAFAKATGEGISKASDKYAKWLMKGDLAWQVTPATKATGTASYEWREYDNDTDAGKRSGEYLQLGLGVGHQLFDSTSLNFKYDLKDVHYSQAYPSYAVRILELSLKTEF